MPRELTESELERIEQDLADLFVHECDSIADELEFERPFTTLEDAAINAVFDARHRQKFIDLALQNEPDTAA
jgi:hypothetical protein